jgi:hypothetical protein
MRVRIPIAVTLAAVMAVGSFGINTVSAAPVAPLLPAVSHSVGNDAQVIQVASKKKRYRGNNNAAAAAAFMGIIGGMIALSARERDYDRGYYYNRGYAQNYYGSPGYAYQQRQYRRNNSGSYRQRSTVPHGGGSIYGGSTVPYGSPDHRGAPQRHPSGGWYPQNVAPDAR